MDEKEYIDLFNNFKTIIDKQLEYFETNTENNHELANKLPALISLINTIEYLRGQEGMFLNFRPHTSNQAEFYKIENEFEKRLEKLITRILNSEEAEFYKTKIHTYFCEVRTKTNTPITTLS